MLGQNIEHDKVMQALKSTVTALNWKTAHIAETKIYAKAKVNWLSWGEDISIYVMPDTSIQIESKCILPTQCIDLGKNKKNVEKFKAQLQAFFPH
ncbi:DUF1499 domain-containing protein [Pseudomonas sp. F1_0610]|uniref:DUF1499 domain-containing protein n=1 Tax=Pseudomonas sp. F1_0610 TaxID=3114284 RepID=UPI0039C343E6